MSLFGELIPMKIGILAMFCIYIEPLFSSSQSQKFILLPSNTLPAPSTRNPPSAVLRDYISSFPMKHLLKPAKHEQLLDFLGVCLDMQNTAELEALLSDICTNQELVSLAERWTIAKLLHMGFSYRTITVKTGASAATISRMARLLVKGSGLLRDACQLREQQFVIDRSDTMKHPLLCRSFTVTAV